MNSEHQQAKTFGYIKNRPGLVYLRGVRVGPFAAMYRPAPNLSGKEQYSATCIISEEQLKFLEGEMQKAAKNLWKDKAEQVYKSLKPDFKAARVRSDKYLGEYPSVKVTRNATTEKGAPVKPPVLKQRVYKGVAQRQCVEGEEGSIYDGCYVTLITEPRAYEFKGAKGVKFEFVGMSFERDGDPFVGKTIATDDDFDSLADEAEDPEDLPW